MPELLSARRFSLAAPTLAFAALAGFAFEAQAQAQTRPDAGTLQRETERTLTPRPERPAVGIPAPRPLAEDGRSTRVTVKRITITGATLLPLAELDALVAEHVGQSLTLAELEHAAQRIAEHYRQRGWFARVYLPQQDVTEGHLRIQVLEGRYGGSRAESKGSRADAGRVAQGVTQRLRAGEPLSALDLERGLLLANDLPGISATGVLEAGDTPGQTRVAVVVDDTPLLSGDVGVSNHGVKATGHAHLFGGVAFNNLSGRGDQLSLRALAASGIRSVQLRYSLPLGHDGWRMAAHASALSYQLGGRFRSLSAQGTAHTVGLNLSYPLIRQVDRNLRLSAGYERRDYDDDLLGAALRRHRVDAVTFGLDGDRRDTLWGGGVTWGGVDVTQGRLRLANVAGDRATDAAGPRTQGSYHLLGFRLSRLQALGSSGWQMQGTFMGQVANGNLGSSERFTLGGPHRVRAYPANEASGDEGMLFKLELQRQLGDGWQAVVFYDTGRIRQHKQPWSGWDGGTGQANQYRLSGAGLGLNWRGVGDLAGWQLNTSVAVPAGGHPGKDAQGRNQDGSRASGARYWLHLSRTF